MQQIAYSSQQQLRQDWLANIDEIGHQTQTTFYTHCSILNKTLPTLHPTSHWPVWLTCWLRTSWILRKLPRRVHYRWRCLRCQGHRSCRAGWCTPWHDCGQPWWLSEWGGSAGSCKCTPAGEWQRQPVHLFLWLGPTLPLTTWKCWINRFLLWSTVTQLSTFTSSKL